MVVVVVVVVGSYYVGGKHIVTQVDNILVGFSLTNFLSFLHSFLLTFCFISLYMFII